MNKNLRPGLAVAIILITASIIGIGLWLYEADPKENIPVSNQVSIQPQTPSEVKKETAAYEEIETPAKESAAVSTEGWKTCRNSKFHYSVDYPTDWTISRPPFHEVVSECNYDYLYFSHGMTAQNPQFIAVNVETQNNLDDTIYKGIRTLDEYFGRNPAILEKRPIIRESIIDGEKAVWLEDRPSPNLYLLHQNDLYEIRGRNISENVFNIFISSFHFLE